MVGNHVDVTRVMNRLVVEVAHVAGNREQDTGGLRRDVRSTYESGRPLLEDFRDVPDEMELVFDMFDDFHCEHVIEIVPQIVEILVQVFDEEIRVLRFIAVLDVNGGKVLETVVEKPLVKSPLSCGENENFSVLIRIRFHEFVEDGLMELNVRHHRNPFVFFEFDHLVSVRFSQSGRILSIFRISSCFL